MAVAAKRAISVLVVEDEALIALDVKAMLTAAGYTVLGPVASVQAALALVGATKPDVALLDVNLKGEKVFPVAELLAAAGAPFILLTGADVGALPPEHRGRPVLAKPFHAGELLAALDGVVAVAVGGKAG